MRYELTKDLETGNAIIDKEHRELLETVNKLVEACSQGQGRSSLESTTKFLTDYVDKHFAHEEDLQKRHNYPAMAAHKAFHESYKKKLRELVAAIPANGPTVSDVAAINSHVAALVSHIRLEDKKLGAFLKNK